MATWTTDGARNKLFDYWTLSSQDSARARGKKVLCWLAKMLITQAGWTHVGSGSGTGKSFLWGGACVLPDPDSATLTTDVANGAWFIVQNAFGTHVGFQIGRSGLTMTEPYQMHMRWSSNGYVSTGATVDTWPTTAPGDECSMLNGGNPTLYTDVGGYNATTPAGFRLSMAYTTDHNSFIVFGKRGKTTVAEFCIAFMKVEGSKTGDTRPFWSYFNTYDAFTRRSMGIYVTTGATAGIYPTGPVQKVYTLAEMIVRQTPPVTTYMAMDYVMPDPITGTAPMLPCIVVCSSTGFTHIRGTADGIMRVPSYLHTGDRLVNAGAGVYDWIVMNDYAVPWKSSDAFL